MSLTKEQAQKIADDFYSATVLGGTWPDADAESSVELTLRQLHYSDEFMQGVMYCWIQNHAMKGAHPNEVLAMTMLAFPIFAEML